MEEGNDGEGKFKNGGDVGSGGDGVTPPDLLLN